MSPFGLPQLWDKMSQTLWGLCRKCVLAISCLGIALSYTTRKADRKEGWPDGDFSENMLRPYPAPALSPHIPPEKRSKWRWQPHIFLKNLPSLTGTFLDDFRTGPAGIFQNPFHARQLAQPGPPAIQWQRKTSSHIPRHFFIISKWGSRKIF